MALKIFSEGFSFIVVTFENGLVTVVVVGETVFEVKVPLIAAVAVIIDVELAALLKAEIEVIAVGVVAEVVVVEVVDATLLKGEVVVEVLRVGVVDVEHAVLQKSSAVW